MSQKRRFHLTPRRRAAGFVIAAVVGLVAAVGVVRVADGPITVGTNVVVPEVQGLRAADAERTLDEADLVVETVSRVSDVIPIGIALGTEPPAGTKVAERSPVTLFVSSGGAPVGTVNVPDVFDETFEIANAALVAKELIVKGPSFEEADVAVGHATRTAPPAGTPVDLGSDVQLFLSLGRPPPGKTKVPPVRLQPEGVATELLRAAFLTPVVERVSSEDVAAGLAIGTSPGAGAEVDREFEVALLISTGSTDPRLVTVPDVDGLSEAEARSRIEPLLPVVSHPEPSDTVEKDHVISSDPRGGAMVPAGTTVDLAISEGPLSVSVKPDRLQFFTSGGPVDQEVQIAVGGGQPGSQVSFAVFLNDQSEEFAILREGNSCTSGVLETGNSCSFVIRWFPRTSDGPATFVPELIVKSDVNEVVVPIETTV